MTCYDKISFNPQSLLGALQRHLYAVGIYMVNPNPPDLWLIIARSIQSLRAMAFLFLKSSISWTGLAEVNHLPNYTWLTATGKCLFEKKIEKTAVVTHCGLFEFISMPFGLKTAGATFQRLMQATFSDFLMGNVTGSSDHQHGFCMPYVDALIARSTSHVDALEHYRRIFQRATQVGMQFKPSKCAFFLKSP